MRRARTLRAMSSPHFGYRRSGAVPWRVWVAGASLTPARRVPAALRGADRFDLRKQPIPHSRTGHGAQSANSVTTPPIRTLVSLRFSCQGIPAMTSRQPHALIVDAHCDGASSRFAAGESETAWRPAVADGVPIAGEARNGPPARRERVFIDGRGAYHSDFPAPLAGPASSASRAWRRRARVTTLANGVTRTPSAVHPAAAPASAWGFTFRRRPLCCSGKIRHAARQTPSWSWPAAPVPCVALAGRAASGATTT